MRRYRSVLVTGASRGLGAALARELAAREYHVVLAARSVQDLQLIAQPLVAQFGERVHTLALDLADRNALDTAFAGLAAEVEQKMGPLDVLINNAGVGSYKPFIEWTAGEITHCLNVNLLAPALLTHAFLPGMVSRKRGMIVNVASDIARRHIANMAPYVASKAGLLGLSGSLLREVRGHGIKVTTILPGIIDTAFNGASEGDKDESWALRPSMLAARIVDTLELPEHVVMDEITIHPMHQDF
jgi:short-subunit dehydrogenase